MVPVLLSAPNTGLRQPHEQTAWTVPSPSCWMVVECCTTIGVLPVNDRAAHRPRPGAGARAREVTGLASSPVSPVPARAMTSQRPTTLAASETPGTSWRAAVTTAAGPASARIRMYEVITSHPPNLLRLFNRYSPTRSSMAPAPADADLARFGAR